MSQLHPRVSVCLVTGATGAGKSTFISALAAARPSAERWAVLNNDVGEFASTENDATLTVSAIGGCACCTGQIMLQTAIVQLLRRTRPSRLIIEASAAAEPAALERALLQEHLARAVQVTLRLCLASASLWATHPPAGRELLLNQMRSADHLVTRDAAAAAALRTALADTGIATEKIIHADDAVRLALATTPVSSASSRRISS